MHHKSITNSTDDVHTHVKANKTTKAADDAMSSSSSWSSRGRRGLEAFLLFPFLLLHTVPICNSLGNSEVLKELGVEIRPKGKSRAGETESHREEGGNVIFQAEREGRGERL